MPDVVIISSLLAFNDHLSIKEHEPTEQEKSKVQLELRGKRRAVSGVCIQHTLALYIQLLY